MRSSVDLVKTRISLSLASSLLDSQNANYEAGMHTSGHLGGDSLLVPPDLTERDGTRPVPVRLLDTARLLRRGLAGSLGGD